MQAKFKAKFWLFSTITVKIQFKMVDIKIVKVHLLKKLLKALKLLVFVVFIATMLD